MKNIVSTILFSHNEGEVPVIYQRLVVEPLLRLQLLDLVQHEVLLVWPVGGGATDVMGEWKGRGVEDE